MFNTWLLNRRRRSAAGKTNDPVMLDFLSTELPPLDAPARECSLLAADFEMTGLNAAEDDIVSVGWVAIDDGRINNGSARHYYLKHSQVDLQASAPIHKIRHSDLNQGHSIKAVFNEFLQALSGRVLIVHHAPLDMSFANKVCLDLYGNKTGDAHRRHLVF